MAVNLRASVISVIKELKKIITQKTSEVTSLKNELRRHERVYKLLGGGRARTRRTRARGKRAVTVDWNSVLGGLPATFTLDHIAKKRALKSKPRVYLRQAVFRWSKQGKIKRIGQRRFRKV